MGEPAPEIEGVRITVNHGPDLPPEILEYGQARVVAQMDGDLVIIRKWQRVTRRWRRGEWTGYAYELIYKQPRQLPF
jgi:hypothetical protein